MNQDYEPLDLETLVSLLSEETRKLMQIQEKKEFGFEYIKTKARLQQLLFLITKQVNLYPSE
jgi:hypothetical protein